MGPRMIDVSILTLALTFAPALTGSAPLNWVRNGAVTEQARAVMQILREADAKGLNPKDYDGPRWADRLEALRPGSDLAKFDLALTVCTMQYASDLRFGRADPGLFRHESLDLPSFLQRLIQASDVEAVLDEMDPPYEGYRRTERALRAYLAMAPGDPGVFLLATKKPVEPGDRYPAATQLASLLRWLGDLQTTAPLDSYAGPLVDAVKRFQSRHGLEPDGRLGKATLAQLNVPLSRRVRQLQLTLERWRWVPHSFPRPPIVVNIPEFELRALNERYETELRMKVVVGKAYRHQTPVFAAGLTQVIFRPYWNVPRSIQAQELVPKLELDSSFAAKNDYEVVNAQDTFVTNGIVDDRVLGQLRSGKLRLRQTPGPKNALGLVKFLFPNEHDVYMHATPATQLFSKSRRDFSHGCIRLGRPEQLAAWVLREYPEWTPERIASAMNGGKTIRVNLDNPIPVLIVYATAVALDNGEVRFFEDIYKQDAKLEALLATSAGRGLSRHE